MKRNSLKFLAGALVSIALLLAGLGAPSARAEAADYTAGEIVLKLFQPGDLDAIAAAYQLNAAPLAQFGSRPIYRLQILDGALAPNKADALAADPRVEYAEPNYEVYAPESKKHSIWAVSSGSSVYGEQWADAKIRVDAAHTVTRGAGVRVAVLDTGIDAAHPVFAGKLIPGYDFVDMDAEPHEVGAAGQDAAFGHGTHVAGLIALVAPEAKIMPLRVLDRDGIGNVWVLAEALAFAADPDRDEDTDDGADVINMSLSTRRPTELLDELVDEFSCGADDDCEANNERGIVIVSAAGNHASDIPEYPAGENSKGALAVGASDAADDLAGFSNFGTWVDVLAPGENIVSAIPNGAYAVWSGTSMAAPLVAGQAALLRAKYPRRNASRIVQLILDTADPVNGSVPKRIDAAAAVGLP